MPRTDFYYQAKKRNGKMELTVRMAFPVLSSFNDGPLMSVSRKKCFPFIDSVVAISLNSCIWQP